MKEVSWEDFQKAGLFWWINRSLHLFGWSLMFEENEAGKIERVYPVRSSWFGFPESIEADGFEKLRSHLKEDLAKE